MAKNKNRLSFEANLSKHPHDLSAAYSASLATGQIIPQWFDIAQPGDRYIFKPKMFARLQNVVKAFLGEVDLNVKVFFVPMQMLYTPYGQIFAQTNDVLSSTLKNLPNKDTYPLLNLEDTYDIPPQYFWFGHKECAGIEVARLLDALDCNPYGVLNTNARNKADFDPTQYETSPIDNGLCRNPWVSPWLFAAYQAIYQKAFRNDEFEKFDIQAYNIDQYYSSERFVNSSLLKLRYVQRPADYFTKVRVSPIASAINKVDVASVSDADITGNNFGGEMSDLLGKVSSWLGESYNNIYSGSTPEGANVGDEGNTSFFNQITGFNFAGGAFNYNTVASVRAAFALDKFLRIYGRAGKTYDEQVLAHFGIKIPHDVKHDLTEICHIHGALTAEPIYATATIGADAAGSSVLGDVGGQGQVTVETDKKIKFTAPVHGVLMAVAYAVTKPRYFGTFSKLNLLGSRIDFPIPEFDKLGAQPMFEYEYNPRAIDELYGAGGSAGPQLTGRFGWQNRYQQFKEKYNRCSFIYASFSDFAWAGANVTNENTFRPWILSRPAFDFKQAIDQQQTMDSTDLWERPDALNSVMDVLYSGQWSNEFFVAPHLMCQTDPIITDFFMDCTKVSWMSPTGEPDL